MKIPIFESAATNFTFLFQIEKNNIIYNKIIFQKYLTECENDNFSMSKMQNIFLCNFNIKHYYF